MSFPFSRSPRIRNLLSYFLALQFFLPGPVVAGTLAISQTPLAKSASASVHPNLMFILDNSGSMDWDYLPDYVNDNDTCKSALVSASITFTAASSAAVNRVRVNPAGACTVSKTNLMDGSTTSASSTPSTVASRIENEEQGSDGWAIDVSGSTITVYNTDGTENPLGCQLEVVLSSGTLSPLTATFTASDTTKACVKGDPPYMSADYNAIYYNPEFVYPTAVNYDGSVLPAQTSLASNRTDPFRTTTTTDNQNGYTETVWCNTGNPTAADISGATNTTPVCRVATDDYNYPNSALGFAVPKTRSAAPYYYRAKVTAWCSDEKLTTCMQRETSPGAPYVWPARVRFCKPASTTDCQRSYNSLTGYTKPSYLNATISSAAYATIDITTVSLGLSISTITVDGVNAISGYTVTAGASDTTSTIATAVANAINSAATTPEYRACVGTRTADNTCSGSPTSRVTIFPQIALGSSTALLGTSANGRVLATTAPALAYVPATGTITVSGTSAAPVQVTSITVGGTTVASGTLNAANGLDSAAKRNAFAAVLAGAITGGGYTATAAGNVVTITAPPNTGASANGRAIVVTGSQSAASSITLASSGNNTSVALTTRVLGTTAISSSTAATGTNDAGEANALAITMAANASSGYTASASGNVVSLYTSLGTTSTATPTVMQTPSTCSGAGGCATISIDNITNGKNWEIDWISLVAGGACVLSDANILASDTTDQNTATNLAAAVDAVEKGIANRISISRSGSVLSFIGIGSMAGAALNGCTLSVRADEKQDGGTITINGVSASGDTTYNNLVTFAGGGAAAMATVATPVTAFAGGYIGSTSPGFVTIPGALAGGTTAGPIGATKTDFVNGADIVKTFDRCDITATSTNCDGPAAGQFPRASTRTDCANAGYCTHAEESLNFGNWYSYYRKRMLAMKSAASSAFSGIGDNYRLGFVTIGNYDSGDGASSFLPVSEFTAGAGGHKQSWYSTLFSQATPNATPLRHALSSVGRYFAGRNPYTFTTVDPMQYACQQNFALLTTDGYWNEPWDSDIKKVDGNTMNNADGVAGTDRPYYDGGLGGTCGVGNNVSGASSCGTLADIAYHFYNTDLRTTTLATNPGATAPADDCKGSAASDGTRYDVCDNQVKGAGDDNVAWQHMTTYTLGLGVDGTLDFRDDYKSATTGDYAEIKAGTKNWPQAKNLDPTAVDDLWHAAVNGRGQYFSAKNPALLTKNLRDALAGIGAQVGAGAAAATSNLEPSEGENNYSFVASYTSAYWYGNLEQRSMNATTGLTLEQALWCAEDVAARADKGTTACTGTLKSKVAAFSDSRNIYLFDSGAAKKRRSFTYGNLTGAEKLYFDPAAASPVPPGPSDPLNLPAVPALSQYAALGVSTKANATGITLVEYLRGQWGYEDQDGNVDRIYRDRRATLGDAVGSQPVFVGIPRLNYSDPGFAGFKSSMSTRGGTVYLGTNDGMMHAFNAANGEERWAYIPSAGLPNMKRLADANYGGTTHRYFVDGSPVVSDVCTANCTDTVSAVWKTILVGGLGAGGKGYYALDITDPDDPKGLWEFTAISDPDMGYSYGNPIITKRDDGTWVVLLTSGYNNVGSGKGFLFVVDIATGNILKKIGTEVGDATTPSGLAKIEAVVLDNSINKASHVYGGDLYGNLWRFTIDKDAEAVVKIAAVKDSSGNPQPITTRPLPTNLDDANATRYIVIATGQLIETDDLNDTQTQTLYAFVDKYDDTGFTVGECVGCTKGARDQLLGQTMVDGPLDANGRVTRVTAGEVDNAVEPEIAGCYADFPKPKERLNVDMKLTRGTVTAVTNEPAADACTAGGRSYKTDFDYKTCKVIDSFQIGDALAVGIVVLKLPSGGYAITATLADNPTPVLVGDVKPAPSVGTTTFGGRRVGWRLLYD